VLSVELARTADVETNGKLVRAIDASTDDGGSFMVGLFGKSFECVGMGDGRGSSWVHDRL
jgi:hypothetical protein